MAHTPGGDAATPRPESDAPEEGRSARPERGDARDAREARDARGELPEQLRLPVPVQVAVVSAAPRTPRRVARQLAFPVMPDQPVRPGPRGPAARAPRPGERERAAATRAAGEKGRGPERESATTGEGPGGAVERADAPCRGAAPETREEPRTRTRAVGSAGSRAEGARPGHAEVLPLEAEGLREGSGPVRASARGAGASPAGRPRAAEPGPGGPFLVPEPAAVIPRQPAPPGEDVHPVLRKAGAPPAARDLLDRAREELAVARDETGAERYAAAHRAALRAASAVLAVHGPPPGTRPRGRRGIRSAWETLAEAVPDLAPWTLLFTASAAHRARAEAGLHDPASTDQADELLRAAEEFTDKATILLAFPEPHRTP